MKNKVVKIRKEIPNEFVIMIDNLDQLVNALYNELGYKETMQELALQYRKVGAKNAKKMRKAGNI